MRSFFTLLTISILLSACQKELKIDLGSGTGPTSCNTYFPTTTGTTWTYDVGGASQTNTIVTPDTIINGNTFKRTAQTVSGMTTNVFVREASGNVYIYSDLGAGGIAGGQVLFNPLRHSAAVGDKWRDTSVINGVSERFEYTMLEKDVNYQVDTFHFTNVDHVQYTVKFDFPPIFNDELIQITDAWFAKCVGAVETKTATILMGVPVGTTDQKIKSYTIH